MTFRLAFGVHKCCFDTRVLAPLTFPATPAVLVIKDDDFGFEDDVLGVAEVDLADAECILNPRQPVSMSIRLMPGDSLGNAEDLKARSRLRQPRSLALARLRFALPKALGAANETCHGLAAKHLDQLCLRCQPASAGCEVQTSMAHRSV